MARNFQAELDASRDNVKKAFGKNAEPDLTPPEEPEGSTEAEEEATEPVDNAEEETAEHPEESAPEMVDIETHQKALDAHKAATKRMHEATTEAANLRKELEALRANSMPSGEDEELDTMPPSEPISEDAEHDLSSIVNDYPELAPLVAIVDAIKQKIGGVEADFNEYRTQQHSMQFWQAVKGAHPDIETYLPVVGAEEYTPEQQKFADWFNSQPEEVQSMLKKDATADEANKALAMFYDTLTGTENESEPEESAETEGEKPAVAIVIAGKKPVPSKEKIDQAKATSAVNIKPNGANPNKTMPKFTRAQIEKMSPDEYMRNKDEIMAQMKRGEI